MATEHIPLPPVPEAAPDDLPQQMHTSRIVEWYRNVSHDGRNIGVLATGTVLLIASPAIEHVNHVIGTGTAVVGLGIVLTGGANLVIGRSHYYDR
jgi:hypothetical protein